MRDKIIIKVVTKQLFKYHFSLKNEPKTNKQKSTFIIICLVTSFTLLHFHNQVTSSLFKSHQVTFIFFNLNHIYFNSNQIYFQPQHVHSLPTFVNTQFQYEFLTKIILNGRVLKFKIWYLSCTSIREKSCWSLVRLKISLKTSDLKLLTVSLI